MNLELKPNTVIVSVLEPIDLKKMLFEDNQKDEVARVVGVQCDALYNKVKILKAPKQSEADLTKQLSIKEGDICILAAGAISIVNREANVTLGFAYIENLLAKIVE